MDKRAIKGEETYQNIINSTLDIIAKEGISGVSAAKVSQRAGISKSSVFHHFKSVNDILVATLNKIIDIMISQLSSEETSTLADMLESFERTLFSEGEEMKMIEIAFLAFYNESMFQDSYKEIFCKFLEVSTNQLNGTLVKIGIRKEKANNLSQLMIATLDGLGIQRILTDNRNECYETWLDFKHMVLAFYKESK